MRSKQPWSLLAKILLPDVPSPTLNLAILKPFPSRILKCHFLGQIKRLWSGKEQCFPQGHPATKGKDRTKTQAFQSVNLLFTQHPAVSPVVEGGTIWRHLF